MFGKKQTVKEEWTPIIFNGDKIKILRVYDDNKGSFYELLDNELKKGGKLLGLINKHDTGGMYYSIGTRWVDAIIDKTDQVKDEATE